MNSTFCSTRAGIVRAECCSARGAGGTLRKAPGRTASAASIGHPGRAMTMIDPHERWKPHRRPDYAGLQSFGGRPYTESVEDLAGVDVAFVGAPLDELVTDLPGARLGPRAI